jgi:TrmH RNA methyltransferase
MSLRRSEQAICGFAAVSALFARRPEAIRRLFFDSDRARSSGAMSKWLAARKKIYRQVESAELEKVSGTVHHGGIVAIATEPPLLAPTEDDVAAWVAEARPVVLLDRIGNAHNLGAIVRTAAFFGVRHVILASHPQQALPGEAAYRVAEGGFEYLTVWCVEDMAVFGKYLRRSFALVGATLEGEPITSFTREGINGKLLSGRPTALILGNEERGIAPEIAKVCNRLVKVAGGLNIQSLNVSAAAAILIASAAKN